MRALEVSRDVESMRADVDDAMVRAIRDGTARSVDLVRRFDAPTLRASAVHRVARAVTSSRAVVTLTLAGHALALDSVRALAAALAAAPALRTLDLGDCAVDDPPATQVGYAGETLYAGSEWEAAGFAEKEDDWFFFAWDEEDDEDK